MYLSFRGKIIQYCGSANMKDKKWLFVGKRKEGKNKQISKTAKNQEQGRQSIQSFNFKKRKIPQTAAISLQNLRVKLRQIYQTCKFYRLAEGVFILSVRMMKTLYLRNPHIKITSAETLACLTVAIKFQSAGHGKLIKIISSKSKIANSQLIGAELHVLQTLQFKIPTADRFWEQLHTATCEWNSFVDSQHPDKSKHFRIEKDQVYTCQSFQNHVNLIIMTNFIMTLHLVDGQASQHLESIEQCMNLALFLVVRHGGSSIYIGTNLKSMMMEYWRVGHAQDKVMAWVGAAGKIEERRDWQGLLQQVSGVEYKRIRKEIQQVECTL